MRHATTITFCALLCCTGGCSDSGDDGPVGDNPLGEVLPPSTGKPLADRLIDTARTYGYQSPNTVPAGWEMVLVGERGCAISVPPGWRAQGAGTAVTSVEEDAEGYTGVLVMAGVPQTSIACTPGGATDYLLAGIEQSGCGSIDRLYYQEETENIAGIPIPKADLIMSCVEEGELAVGYAWVTIQGTTPLCNILVLGFWMPEPLIEAKTCTLSQILQSVRCPQGGRYCVDADCNADCVELGKGGGHCNADDDCVCN